MLCVSGLFEPKFQNTSRSKTSNDFKVFSASFTLKGRIFKTFPIAIFTLKKKQKTVNCDDVLLMYIRCTNIKHFVLYASIQKLLGD